MKITPKKIAQRESITMRTQEKPKLEGVTRWWAEKSKTARAEAMIATASFLKEQQQYRYRQASMYGRLYGNIPIFGAVGSNLTKLAVTNTIPSDRPTMNVIQSCVDTSVSRISQGRPRPLFLTDNGDYRERRLAKQMNTFISGELYQTKAYDIARLVLRDAEVLGTGCIKIYEDQKKRVALDRVLLTELLVDQNDGLYGKPRSMYELKLVDREVLMETFPEARNLIEKAEQAYPEAADSSKTVSDQVMVVEGWHLASGPDADDGKRIIACSAGCLVEEDFEEEDFPFVFLHYSPRLLGFWSQGLAEQLMGTQMEINKLLVTISQAINLVGVPRVFVEDGSKVVKSHLNNQIGAIVTYRGTKPEYEVAPCVPAELYGQLQRLIDYAYQQSGVSALAASSKKPEGLNSGVAIREFDDLQSDRFADLEKRYDGMFIDLAYKIIGKAKDIAEREGKYQTVYPNKNGTKEVDLPRAKLLDDPFVIQCYDVSSLPRDPAGRLQKITEMIQAGMVTIQEGRRLLDYPDLEQAEKLANSGEERILQILDEIVEDGKYTPPDPFMDPDLAIQLSVQYYNLYAAAKLDEDKAEMLRTFNSQAIALKMAATPPTQPGTMGPQAPGLPMQPSPLVPQGV